MQERELLQEYRKIVKDIKNSSEKISKCIRTFIQWIHISTQS